MLFTSRKISCEMWFYLQNIVFWVVSNSKVSYCKYCLLLTEHLVVKLFCKFLQTTNQSLNSPLNKKLYLGVNYLSTLAFNTRIQSVEQVLKVLASVYQSEYQPADCWSNYDYQTMQWMNRFLLMPFAGINYAEDFK